MKSVKIRKNTKETQVIHMETLVSRCLLYFFSIPLAAAVTFHINPLYKIEENCADSPKISADPLEFNLGHFVKASPPEHELHANNAEFRDLLVTTKKLICIEDFEDFFFI